MTGLRIGELFSGYGGLGMGVQAVLGGEVAWHSDIDPGACRILEHRYPGVPNHGDITTVDWSAVEPVDVLTGGFPCQDVSHAGKRLGIHPDSRSGLWTHFAYAISQLRPPLVVIENVRGLLSAPAHGVVEPCPWCVGDDERFPLRALGAVLGDLAELGYVGRWGGLRAADVGAPHGRFRVFVVAWPAADAESFGRHQGRPEPTGLVRRPDASFGDGGAPANTERGGRHGWPGELRPRRRTQPAHGGDATAHADDAADDRERSRPGLAVDTVANAKGHAWGLAQGDRGVAADSHSAGCGRLEELHAAQEAGHGASHGHDADRLAVAAGGVDWGVYATAIRRWEGVTGRPAPSPTERGKNGQPRLAPAFVEWMMGLPAGWVCDVPGLSRNDQLKALGNGVVPQQAAHALRLLLADVPAPPVPVATEGAA